MTSFRKRILGVKKSFLFQGEEKDLVSISTSGIPTNLIKNTTSLFKIIGYKSQAVILQVNHESRNVLYHFDFDSCHLKELVLNEECTQITSDMADGQLAYLVCNNRVSSQDNVIVYQFDMLTHVMTKIEWSIFGSYEDYYFLGKYMLSNEWKLLAYDMIDTSQQYSVRNTARGLLAMDFVTSSRTLVSIFQANIIVLQVDNWQRHSTAPIATTVLKSISTFTRLKSSVIFRVDMSSTSAQSWIQQGDLLTMFDYVTLELSTYQTKVATVGWYGQPGLVLGFPISSKSKLGVYKWNSKSEKLELVEQIGDIRQLSVAFVEDNSDAEAAQLRFGSAMKQVMTNSGLTDIKIKSAH